MADFKLYFPILLSNEGYYANEVGDTGGETWIGISRNNYPNWSGWSIIDSHRPVGGFKNNAQANSILKPLPDLNDLVIKFYKESQWNPVKGDEINNQSIADFICDWAVNAGIKSTVIKIQHLLTLKPDGIIGPKTLEYLNTKPQEELFNQLKARRESFYRAIVRANPSQKKFLNTWLSRNNSFTFKP